MAGPVVHDMTHEAIVAINRLAPYIDAALRPLGYRFILVIAEEGDGGPGRASYICNTDTPSVIRVLRETADAIERGA